MRSHSGPRAFLTAVLLSALLLDGGCGLFGTSGPPTPAAAPTSTVSTDVTPVGGPRPGTGESAAIAPPLQSSRPELLAAVDLSDLDAGPVPVTLTACRSEWASVVLRVRTPAPGEAAALVLPQWTSGGKTLGVRGLRVYQVLPMPLNVNRAGYVRQTGQAVGEESLPRALLPVPISNGRVDLARLRDPAKPTDPRATAVDANTLLWVEWRVPTDAAPGHYDAAFGWETPGGEKTPAETRAGVAAGLDVADFVLPDDRHLSMVADLSWDRLRRLWPERFEVVRPQLLSRQSPDGRPAVEMLDQLMQLAQENRVQVHVPRLQPVAKWKPGLPVQVDWADYDGLIGPWLSGAAFADKVGLGFWALPKVDYLENRPAGSQTEYYAAAAGHFDGRDWLRLAPVILTKDTPGQATLEERLRLSVEAARVLSVQQRVRVMLPLEPGEAMLADAANPTRIAPADTGRLNCVAPGLISNAPLGWPAELTRPQKFLRTDLSGLIPYTGAGASEADVRVWAWTAFVRDANLVQWDTGLPAEATPQQAADPNELVWFYPGSWFGVEAPVPTVQLKWLRRAEQDFEYLYLAAQRDERSKLDVLPIARVLSKPVVIRPGQAPDPVYSLLIGTADERAWQTVRPLVTQIIQSRGPGITPDDNAIADLQQQMLQWIEPLERPIILPRATDWSVGAPPPGEAGPWVNLRLGFDVYNSSDTTPNGNELSLARPNPGWMVDAAPVPVPQLAVFSVAREGLNARLNPAVTATTPQPPVRIDYKSRFNGTATPLDLEVPVRRSTRRTANLVLNGSLDDWTDYDAFQAGPLVKMVSRPSVQQHTLERAKTPTKLYSGWTDTDLYLAFHVEGLSKAPKVLASRNYVEYQDDRAWGEDVCQAVIQAVYDDGTTGPLVTVAVKPGGNDWEEKRAGPRQPWQKLQTSVRYAATIDAGVWRGEIAVPWDALTDPAKDAAFAAQGRPNLPTLLKFNFVQHKRETGESATWAGPVDTARDGGFTGVLVLKDAE